MNDLDPNAARARVEWLRENEEQCRLSPGQVSMSGYIAASVDCAKDVPVLLAEVERLRRDLAANESSEDARLAIAEAEVERLRAAETRLRNLAEHCKRVRNLPTPQEVLNILDGAP